MAKSLTVCAKGSSIGDIVLRYSRHDQLMHTRYYQPNPEAQGCQPLPQLASLGNLRFNNTRPKKSLYPGRGYAKTCSPDTALTAFTQLVAWKLGADRALIRSIRHDQDLLQSLIYA